jgi:hypothetical protein
MIRTGAFLQKNLSFSIVAVGLAALLGACGSAGPAGPANLKDVEADWTEAEVPPPPSYDERKLVFFEMPVGSSLTYSVAPETIVISKADGVVRYVMVAASPSGAKNVMYEGLRCTTAEVKTYARAASDGRWTAVKDSQWSSLYGRSLSPHALRFARAGACDNAAPALSVSDLLARLKTVPLPGGKN